MPGRWITVTSKPTRSKKKKEMDLEDFREEDSVFTKYEVATVAKEKRKEEEREEKKLKRAEIEATRKAELETIRRRREAAERARIAKDPNLWPSTCGVLSEKCDEIVAELDTVFEDNAAVTNTLALRLQYAMPILDKFLTRTDMRGGIEETFDDEEEAEIFEQMLPLSAVVMDTASSHAFEETILPMIIGDSEGDEDMEEVFGILKQYYGLKGSKEEQPKSGQGIGSKLLIQASLATVARSVVVDVVRFAQEIFVDGYNGRFNSVTSFNHFWMCMRFVMDACDDDAVLMKLGVTGIVRVLAADGCRRFPLQRYFPILRELVDHFLQAENDEVDITTAGYNAKDYTLSTSEVNFVLALTIQEIPPAICVEDVSDLVCAIILFGFVKFNPKHGAKISFLPVLQFYQRNPQVEQLKSALQVCLGTNPKIYGPWSETFVANQDASLKLLRSLCEADAVIDAEFAEKTCARVSKMKPDVSADVLRLLKRAKTANVAQHSPVSSSSPSNLLAAVGKKKKSAPSGTEETAECRSCCSGTEEASCCIVQTVVKLALVGALVAVPYYVQLTLPRVFSHTGL